MKTIKLFITALFATFCTTLLKAQTNWKMQPVVLQTRWAKSVTPKNTLEQYPRPQLKRKNWTNLNGLWQFAIVKKDQPSPKMFDGTILVPYPIESALSGVEKALQPNEDLWYKRTFDNTKIGSNRTLLHFGAIDWQATVFINGIEAGKHTGGYTAFTLDITKMLKIGKNELLIKVFDPSDKGIGPHGKQVIHPGNIYYSSTSGIWQTVWLEKVPQIYVANITTTPNIDNNTLSFGITLNDPYAKCEIVVKALKDGKQIAVWHSKHNKGILHIPFARLWSPESPFLYDLSVSLLKNGRTLDKVKSYFGMRKISIGKDIYGTDRINLNNSPYFNLGILDQGFWPDGLYTAPTDEALAYDLKVIKAMGFNTIRKHIKVEPAKWYYDADKIGILVWQDLVNPNQGLPLGSKSEFELESAEIINQLHNYPSIVTWVVFNEEWGAYDQTRITDWVKKTDTTRIIDGHSGGFLFVNGKKSKGVDTAYINSDLTDIHSYPEPMLSIKEHGKAQVCGEFGGIGVSVPGHQWNDLQSWGYIQVMPKELITKYRGMVTALKELKKAGLSGSIFTQPFDVEGEENGLITYDREIIKIPLDTLREINKQLVTPSPLPPNFFIGKNINQEDTDENYLKMLKLFEQGKKDSVFLRRLTLMAIRKKDQVNTTKIGNTYISFLNNPYNKENLLFIGQITRTVKDRGFEIFVNSPEKVDIILGSNVAENKAMGIIYKEEIAPFDKVQNPDWERIEADVIEKHGQLGKERVYGNRVGYYYANQQWNKFGKYYKLYFDLAIPKGRSFLNINNLSWVVFEHIKDSKVIATALVAMSYDLENFEKDDPAAMDTYANLLYKNGDKKNAIKYETKAYKISQDESIKANLEKMEKDLPTWQENSQF